MKRLIWILMTAGLWFGCKPGIPADIIRPDKMEKVLYDIHLVDGYISTIPTVDSSKKIAAAYYNGIYKKFEIDSALYNKSMDYYYDHPEELSLMYKTIGADLKNQIRSIEKSDSLKNDKVIKAQELSMERREDSIAVNLPYNLDHAKRILYLERYNDIHSKNAVIFNLLKIKKNTIDSIKPNEKLKLHADSLKMVKENLKLEKEVMPVEAAPVKLN